MEPNQELPFLRSISNVHSSFVRFVNTTRRSVGVYWIDYQGHAVQYGILSYRDYLDVNTFVTHPWIFVDEETQDRFRVNCSDVFFPEAWFPRDVAIRPDDLPPRVERTCVYITLPIYSLRELCLRVVKRKLRSDWHAFLLDIPRSLQYELASMFPKKTDPVES
ncbi:von Hippel-Lindau disease tumor suppressor [Orussus abietinus]|uniref:von Hippel-Lindau disease tumor suppressor n=1 Tax=Orussus abietinus TaxID=222816 RepID=UPI000625AED2|nr:von Hippel-Lindau disease tumor suppressor [Orussus abietinus]